MRRARVARGQERQITSIRLILEGMRGTGRKGEKQKDGDDECLSPAMANSGAHCDPSEFQTAIIIRIFSSTDFLADFILFFRFRIIFTALLK